MFSCEYCEIFKNSFFYRTPPVAASAPGLRMKGLRHFRSSLPEVFCKKGVLRNFAKFTGKHLWPATLLKKGLWHRCFPVNFAKFLRTPFLQNTDGCFWHFRKIGVILKKMSVME